ncbi:MAG: fluoride efflux transporter CrcB [Candidatus Obscuribacterales bacterium]|nr:fluoride efflux transporter CrcB [Candidatus Obscuribacterales bacterium]
MPGEGLFNMPPIGDMVAVSIGGSIGSILRFLCNHLFAQLLGTTFPWGTLVVNVAGSLLIGFVATLATTKPGSIDPTFRFFLTSGFAGGFTTFSALALESFQLFQKGEVWLAVANVGGNLIIGFAAVVLGVVIAKLI